MKAQKALAVSVSALVAVSVAWAGKAMAAQSSPNGVEVTHADQAHLMSLRGAMPKNDEFSKSPIEHAARPLPWLDGPGTPTDGAQQNQVSTPAAPTMGLGFDGVGQGFKGPQGTFTVDAAPPDTNGAV